MFKRIFKTIISAVFPNTCVGCGEIIPEGEFLCDYCFEMIERVDLEKHCIKCGESKKNCLCKYNIFLYEGCVAPFYNDGIAKKVMYTYKLGSRVYISEFLAQKMVLALKYSYSDIKFDGICYVPITGKAFRKRGFNQCSELASRISEITGIPLLDNHLGAVNKRIGQHSVSKKERFLNVKDKFYSKRPCFGKILLIDDIKTTGATLNECSKVLLNSGAESVWCLTGLISKNKKRDKTRKG